MMGENRIIAFAGRKESGKTELAHICEKYGYNVISFATPLKTLVSELLEITIEDINKLKKIKNNYILNEDKIKYFSEKTDIPFDISNEILKDKIFETTRDVLQFIGTDIIRKYNPLWHIKLTKESMLENEKYCIDDLRFPNEKEMVEELGGDSWFVVRPLINNISNHESETALSWNNFDKIIINNISLSYLQFNWNMFLKLGYDDSLKMRYELMNKIENDKNIYDKLFDIKDYEKHFNLLDTLFISKFLFTPILLINYNEINKIEEIEDNCIKIIYKSNESKVISHPLLIENLKIMIN